jgi:gas vesicle protein GvpA/GvpJ/GvpM family
MTYPPTTGTTQHQPANLGDILERVLDRGIVIAGDIQVNLLDIELLTIKLRLLIVSVDTAREIGIDWWEHDPWLTSRAAKPAVEAAATAADGTEPAAEQGRRQRAYALENAPVSDHRWERRHDRKL